MTKRALPVVLALIVALGGLWLLVRRQPSAPEVAVDRGSPTASSGDPASAELEEIARPSPSERWAVPQPAPAISAESSPPPTHATLDVLVLSAQTRAPLSRVRLSLIRTDLEEIRSVEYVDSASGDLAHPPRSGDDGRATLRLEPGATYRLRVFCEAGPAESRSLDLDPLSAGARSELVIELATAYDRAFHGRVVERTTGSPIAGAVVRIQHLASGWEPLSKAASDPSDESETTSGSDGRFTLHGPSWTTLQGTIDPPDFSRKLFQLVAGHETPERERVFELDRSAILVIRVLDAGREPLAGARVVLKTKPWLLSEDASTLGTVGAADPTFTAETAEDGRATLDDLPASAPFEIAVSSGNLRRRESAPVSLAPSERRELEIVLGGGARLAGKLLETGGAPVAMQRVFLTKPRSPGIRSIGIYPPPHTQAVTDAQGAFVFADVPAGEWLVGPPEERWIPEKKPVSEMLVPIGELVVVEAGVDPAELVLTVVRGLSIRGSVTGPDGPVVGCAVLAAGDDAGAFASGTSGPEGRFEVGPIAPGEYRLWAQPSPLHQSLASAGEVRASAGDEGVGLALALGGSIACEARLADGSRGHTAILLVDGADCSRQAIVFGDAKDGRTTFENLAPCTYSLVATSADPPRIAILRDLRLAPGEKREGVVLELAAAARLRVRCEGAEGYGHVAVRHAGLVVATDGIDAGSTKTFVVPAGSLVVDVHDPREGELAEQTMLLTPGEVRELVVAPRR